MFSTLLLSLLACKQEADTDAVGDADGDGYSVVEGDCDDGDEAVHPEQPETCNSVDDDCDFAIDENGGAGFGDADGDLAGNPDNPSTTCSAVANGDDCNDDDEGIHPLATEVPDDGTDQDCDGFDARTCFVDDDGDTFGTDAPRVAPDGFCDTEQGEAVVAGDCDDSDPDVYPAAHEIDGDDIDQDCDGFDVSTCYLDQDGDGYGTGSPQDISGACEDGYAPVDGDCEDFDAGLNPGAAEVPDDGRDNNCDGLAASSCYEDLDDDRYGSSVVVRIDDTGACSGNLEAPKTGDCADDDPDMGPGQFDRCDGGIDNDCNPATTDSGAEVGGVGYFLLPDAIGAAAAGDVITLCGSGYGDPIVVDKDLTIRSVNGSASTMLDVTGLGTSAITVTDGSLTLEGLTVSWGEGQPNPNGTRAGAGLYAITSEDVTLRDCVFTENYAELGGAIYWAPSSGSPTLTLDGTTLEFNHAKQQGAGVWTSGAVVVLGGAVRMNDATSGGGGFLVDGAGTIDVSGTDLGTGRGDNMPDDVLTVGGAWNAYGLNSTFTCDSSGCTP